MPRKGPVPKRDVIPDPKYGNVKLAKFVNNLMQRGKKSTAEKIIYSALDQVSSKSKRDPLEVFEEALDQVKSILNEIDKSEFETSQFIDYKQQFQIFLFLSLLFIICDVFVFQTKTKWIQNLNLFNENKD